MMGSELCLAIPCSAVLYRAVRLQIYFVYILSFPVRCSVPTPVLTTVLTEPGVGWAVRESRVVGAAVAKVLFVDDRHCRESLRGPVSRPSKWFHSAMRKRPRHIQGIPPWRCLMCLLGPLNTCAVLAALAAWL